MITAGSELSITRQAQLLGVSRSSVHYRPQPESQEELELLKRLDELFTENPMFGSRRLRVMLERKGVRVGRRRIRGLMKPKQSIRMADASALNPSNFLPPQSHQVRLCRRKSSKTHHPASTSALRCCSHRCKASRFSSM